MPKKGPDQEYIDDGLGYLGGVDLGAGVDRGANAEGNYEGQMDPEVLHDFSDGEFRRIEGGTRHQGMIEPDGHHPEHGEDGEYGFLRRPMRRSDVERN